MTFPDRPAPASSRQRTLDQRGAVLPSPVVLLSVLAVVLAAVAFVATRGEEPTERDVSATTAAATPTPSADDPTSSDPGSGSADPTPTPEQTPTPRPVERAESSVVVFNNTQIKGLAGRVSEQVKGIGWQVAAADNWYGTVPATTVYYPQGKKAAAQLLALDLGVARIKPADTGSDMSDTHLTLILTGELG